jgi:flavin reductase (DIM6/NTAB) family NADH-FMN oxidoreductase RutF
MTRTESEGGSLSPLRAAVPAWHRTPGAPWAAVARRCPRTVTVLSTAAGPEVHVITAATFGVVSVDPPLVQVTVGAHGRARALIERSGGFAVSLLSGEQELTALRCALPGRRTGWDHLPAGLWWAAPRSGAPLLGGAPAWLDCRLHTVLDLADKALIVGVVEQADVGPAAPPLVRFDGAYRPLYVEEPSLPRAGDQT